MLQAAVYKADRDEGSDSDDGQETGSDSDSERDVKVCVVIIDAASVIVVLLQAVAYKSLSPRLKSACDVLDDLSTESSLR